MKLKFILPIIAVAMLIFAVLPALKHKQPGKESPSYAPPSSDFENQISGIGVTEPESENIAIGTNLAGIITQVYVKVGEKVKKGDKLFLIDDRETKAQLDQAKASLEMAKVEASEADYKLSLYEKLSDKRAVSQDDLSQRKYAAQLARAKVRSMQAQINVSDTELKRLLVTAPIDGTILKLNVRSGEYATAGNLSNPLIILGNIDTMHVRVEIDETEALDAKPESESYGELRGYGKHGKIKLTFVKKEPYLLPKRSLTGDGNERVDSRVMQVVYSFDNTKIGSMVGQQMDVFINKK